MRAMKAGFCITSLHCRWGQLLVRYLKWQEHSKEYNRPVQFTQAPQTSIGCHSLRLQTTLTSCHPTALAWLDWPLPPPSISAYQPSAPRIRRGEE